MAVDFSNQKVQAERRRKRRRRRRKRRRRALGDGTCKPARRMR
jgi:hypothetical protein